MTKAEILASLKDQAKDKDILANGEKDSIFTRDAQALREAAEMLEKSEVVKHGRWQHLGGDEWSCTVCGNIIYTEGSWEKPTSKYCCECGAKMDGGA